MATLIEFEDRDLRMLEGWLEDQAEGHYPVPEWGFTEEQMEQVADDIFSGRAASPIDVLGQHEPPFAWMLMKIYDSTGWPRAFDEERKTFTRKLIIEAMEEVHKQEQVWRKEEESDDPD